MSLADPQDRATLAIALLRIDPGLGGLVLRARASPVRDDVLSQIADLPGPHRRVHPSISDAALFGGLDLQATLTTGQVTQTRGLLAEAAAGTLTVTMAERLTPALAARLCLAMDRPEGPRVIALDEGAVPEEALPPALADRLAFQVSLDGVRAGLGQPLPQAKGNPGDIAMPEALLRDLIVLCDSLGIGGSRAPLLALRCARAHAVLQGRDAVCPEDLEIAAALTLAHRATRVPELTPEEATEPDTQPETSDNGSDGSDAETLDLPQELMLDAVRALIPDDLLTRLAAARTRSAKGSGTGARVTSRTRGRPLPSRPGRVDGNRRIDLLATLRAAAPWQTIRACARPNYRGLHIRPTDLHVKRYEDRADRLLIFAVDASGSAALARLAEAKGAVELMLAQAYARRDHVALVSFRGDMAETLLPPTRSLVQTKRRLAALPGGGGTPLAAGLQEALALAEQAKRRGMTPTLALLTDGRANVTLEGGRDRKVAAEEATTFARHIAARGVDALVIDTGRRPEPALRAISDLMGGTYIQMPRADAQRLADTARAALDP